MSRRANLLLALGSTILGLALAESAVRIYAPRLGLDAEAVEPGLREHLPYQFDPGYGYEYRPFGDVRRAPDPLYGTPAIHEKLTGDGFRGKPVEVPKPQDVWRILTLGDSVVAGYTVASLDQTWQSVLQQRLQSRLESSKLRAEVLNGGIGGYVSWQIVPRLERHGLRYQADLVMVLVGVNDMVYSSLPEWHARMDLSEIGRAYAQNEAAAAERRGQWPLRQILQWVEARIHLARLAHQVRNVAWNRRRIESLIEHHRRDSGLPFNRRALELYRENLESIRERITAHGQRMALIIQPSLLTADTLEDRQVQYRLRVLYNSFPLSARELYEWRQRYVAVQREFLRLHPEVMPVDVDAAFAGLGLADRLSCFSDEVHLNAAGNRRFAAAVADALTQGARPQWGRGWAALAPP